MFFQCVVSGLCTGVLYSITALGLSLLYKTTGLINFAHGEIAMFTTFISFAILESFKLPLGVVILIGVVISFCIGVFVELVIMRRATRLSFLSQLILTISLYTLFRGIASIIWGYTPRSFPRIVKSGTLKLGFAVVDYNSLVIIGITLVIMIAMFIFFRSRTGLAMRAVAMNPKASKLMGIKVNTINAYTWGIACILGGIAGALIAPTTFVSPTMMSEVLIKSFCAAVLGGFKSLPGVMIGGLIIGILENLLGAYVSAELKTSLIFLLLIIILAVKPSGLLGKKEVKKV